MGHGHRFCLIGERINPTGRRIFQEQLRAGDFSAIERDVKAQVEGGADVLDVNMGVPLTDEPELLAKAIQLVQSLTDLPICIDSSVVEALEAGLSVYQGRALVNSITAEDDRMAAILPLVKKYDAAVIALLGLMAMATAAFMANYFAQTKALAFGKTAEEVRAEGTAEGVVSARVFSGNRPTTSILAGSLTPSVLGQLIALYEHITFVEGVVWGIDSFDQWGVELGKKLALEIAPALTGDSAALEAQDPSTRQLIEHYLAQRTV